MPKKADEMFAWVVVDEDGDEAVPAFYSQAVGGWMPMMGADRERMESMRQIAEGMVKKSGRPFTLVRFHLRQDLEVLKP